jgi:hypothetical protein
MSSAPSPPVQFSLKLGVLGMSPCPPSLKCPPQVSLGFGASWYDLLSPYAGTVDLDSHFAQPHAAHGCEGRGSSEIGYRVPRKGQLQLVIKNPQGTVVKALLVPYDLLDMPSGSRTFIRQMWYGAMEKEDQVERKKEVLRYAIHLHFLSPPASNTASRSKTKPGAEDRLCLNLDAVTSAPPKKPVPKIFLAKTIRLVFPSRTPDVEETLRLVKEDAGTGQEKYSPYFGPDLMDEPLTSRQHYLYDIPTPPLDIQDLSLDDEGETMDGGVETLGIRIPTLNFSRRRTVVASTIGATASR